MFYRFVRYKMKLPHHSSVVLCFKYQLTLSCLRPVFVSLFAIPFFYFSFPFSVLGVETCFVLYVKCSVRPGVSLSCDRAAVRDSCFSCSLPLSVLGVEACFVLCVKCSIRPGVSLSCVRAAVRDSCFSCSLPLSVLWVEACFVFCTKCVIKFGPFRCCFRFPFFSCSSFVYGCSSSSNSRDVRLVVGGCDVDWIFFC